MDMTQETCRVFVDTLASSAPVPGGGGAAALVAAIGTALGHMASNLTVGKPRYAPVEAQLQELNRQFAGLEQELLRQVEADEQSFLPLSMAYRIPRDDPDRNRILGEATLQACAVPLKIMELCCRALDCIEFVAENSSRMVVSDAAAGAVCCKAAMQAASLTIFINTKGLFNRETAAEIDGRVHRMLKEYGALADRIYQTVCAGFGQ